MLLLLCRGGRDITGPMLTISPSDKRYFYDCYHGATLRHHCTITVPSLRQHCTRQLHYPANIPWLSSEAELFCLKPSLYHHCTRPQNNTLDLHIEAQALSHMNMNDILNILIYQNKIINNNINKRQNPSLGLHHLHSPTHPTSLPGVRLHLRHDPT